MNNKIERWARSLNIVGIEKKLPSIKLICFGVTLFGVCLYLVQPIIHPFPLGFAGLYALFSEKLSQNHFAIPKTIPFYGPGGIPAAYPPVGFYLMAVVCFIGKVPEINYLRFAPIIISGIALIPFFFLSLQLTRSKAAAAISVLFIVSYPVVAYFQLTSGGIVRSLGFLFALCALWAFCWALDSSQLYRVIFPGIFLGVTAASHLSYALFVSFSVCIFALCNKNKKTALQLLILTFVVGIITSAPWWINVITQHGVQTLLQALNSHRNMGFLDLIRSPQDAIHWIGSYLFTTFLLVSPMVYFTLLVGLVSIIIIKDFYPARLLGIWAVLEILFQSESERFLPIIFAIACGIGTLTLTLAIRKAFKDDRIRWIMTRFIPLLILFPIVVSFLRYEISQPSSLTPSLVDVGQWMQVNTDTNAKYLFTAFNEDWAEWFPYATRRTPIIGHWGSEWIGTYDYQLQLVNEVGSCSANNLKVCIDDFVARHDLHVTYIITPAIQIEHPIDTYGWKLLYRNNDYLVWSR